jgi:beta-glucosidase
METSKATIQQLLDSLTLEEKIALTLGKDNEHTGNVERLGIPSIVMNDGPHGIRKLPPNSEIGSNPLPSTCFPTTSALASSWNIALAEAVGRAIAEECLALDAQVILAPGVNIKRTPLCGRNFEYYSEDPVVAGEMGCAFVHGVQSQGIGTSLKHYACNNQEFERMSISAEVDQRVLREVYLAAFERIVRKARPWTVMSAYNRVNGLPASAHPQLLHDILKQEWGFEGVIVSDWGAVDDKVQSLVAGLDLQMPGMSESSKHTEHIVQAVKDGRLSETVLDEAVTRVLQLIQRGTEHRRSGSSFEQESHHALARQVAAESMVLLKNEDALLPLHKERLHSVALIGRFAKHPPYQGTGSSHVMPTRLDTTYDAIQHWLGDSLQVTYSDGYAGAEQVDEHLLHEAREQAHAASVALLFVGLPEGSEAEGVDRQHMFLPESHNRLITEVCRVQPNTVVIVHNGSAIAMPWVDQPKAIVEAGLAGQAVGSALVDVLSGNVNPSGKLAETFPVRLEDTPAYLNYPGEAGKVSYGEGLFVGYRYYDTKKIAPLFPFGYGLSYTTFEFVSLQTSAATIRAGETLDVTVTLRNSGDRTGKEVVQLYIHPLNSRFVRPIKELKAFSKVELKPGETQNVHMTLEARDFMVYDSKRQTWYLESDSVELLVGSSSDQLPLRAKVNTQADPQSEVITFTRESSLKDVLAHPQARAALVEAFAGTPVENLISSQSALFTSIPLGKGVPLGILNDEMLDALLAKMNQAVLCSIIREPLT